jgi:hypothetical protein
MFTNILMKKAKISPESLCGHVLCAFFQMVRRCASGLLLVSASLLTSQTIAAVCEKEDYFHPNDANNENPLRVPHREFLITRKLARHDNSLEQRNLAISYDVGYLVSPCPNKALYWYRKAALNGDQVAQRWIETRQHFYALINSTPRNIVTGRWNGPGKLTCENGICAQHPLPSRQALVDYADNRRTSVSAQNEYPAEYADIQNQIELQRQQIEFQQQASGSILGQYGGQMGNSFVPGNQGGMVIGGSLDGSIWPNRQGGMIHGGPLSGSIIPGSEGGMIHGGPLSGTFLPGGEGGMIHGGPLSGSIMPGNEGGMIHGGPMSGTILPPR